MLARLGRGARVVLCGVLSTYNTAEATGLRNYRSLLVNRATMAGFVIFDYAERYGQATKQMAGWLQQVSCSLPRRWSRASKRSRRRCDGCSEASTPASSC